MLQQVRLHFVNVSLECCCRDYVSIYDGNSTSARLLRRLCGYNLPSNVISTGNSLFVYFRSNSHNTYSGFSIEYNAIEGVLDGDFALMNIFGNPFWVKLLFVVLFTTPVCLRICIYGHRFIWFCRTWSSRILAQHKSLLLILLLSYICLHIRYTLAQWTWIIIFHCGWGSSRGAHFSGHMFDQNAVLVISLQLL